MPPEHTPEAPADASVTTPLTQHLQGLLYTMGADVIEREEPLRLMLLAALAGEHCLLIGPPGTAKSLLARRLSLAFQQASYFKRLLTQFSLPDELCGPCSLAALDNDRYERAITGYLPSVEMAFLDEVLKSNPSILNALLTLLI